MYGKLLCMLFKHLKCTIEGYFRLKQKGVGLQSQIVHIPLLPSLWSSLDGTFSGYCCANAIQIATVRSVSEVIMHMLLFYKVYSIL